MKGPNMMTDDQVKELLVAVQDVAKAIRELKEMMEADSSPAWKLNPKGTGINVECLEMLKKGAGPGPIGNESHSCTMGTSKHSYPQVDFAMAIATSMAPNIGPEVGQMLYHGSSLAEVVDKCPGEVQLVGIGWVKLDQCRTKP